MSDDEPKIHIDEDWKQQVEREREQERQQTPGEAAPASEVEEAPDLSPFDMLTSSLAAQTMMALGLARQEGQTQVVVDLSYAQHMIDTLVMLKEKTQGNLEAGEAANLDEAISELKRVFAIREEQVREAAMENPQKPGIDPNPPFLDPSQR